MAQIDSSEYPVARMDSVKDTYFGTVVRDPYRWLEDDSTTETKEWIDAETSLSRKYLSKVRKKYNPEKQLMLNDYADYIGITKSGRYYFDFYSDGRDGSHSLYIKDNMVETGQLIVDAYKYKTDSKDKTRFTTISVSEDNKFLAFGINHNGSDWQEIYVTSCTRPFRYTNDKITGVKFSNIAWYKNGFFYMRYPEKANPLKDKNDNASIWYHKLGTDQDEDSKIYSDPGHPDRDIDFSTTPKLNYLVIYNHYRIDDNIGNLVMTVELNDLSKLKVDTLINSRQAITYYLIGVYKNKFLAYTTQNAPNGQLILIDKNKANDAAIFIPQFKDILNHVSIIGNKIVCVYLRDIDYVLVTFDSSGIAQKEIDFPHGTSIRDIERKNDSIAVVYQYSFINPPVAYRYNVNSGDFALLEQTKIAYDYKDFNVEKVYFNSKDGTRVPMVIAYKKGMKKDGKNPTLLYGYGGYGFVYTPFYNNGFMSFMQNGGIVAVPCLRGGGEYGQKWHNQGSMLNKQNVFDDFIGAADYLVREGYTNREKLVIMGGSNGGLLVAAVLNQRPDICKAAIAVVGVYDMLRYQKYTIGHAWENEYGSGNDSTQFQNLYKYSPIHNINDTSYPAVLVVTADHDDRVVPLHSYKYVATLQKKNRGNNPILLYIKKNAGHQSKSLEADADIYSFIYEQLGVNPMRNHTILY